MDWANMKIMEVLSKHPKAVQILAKYNIGCIGCFAARSETLAEGLRLHKIDIGRVVRELEDTYKN